MKTKELGSDRRSKFMLYYCVAIKVTLKYLKTNQEKKEMFSKELKQHDTTLAFRVKADGCNEDVYCFFTDRRPGGEKPQR